MKIQPLVAMLLVLAVSFPGNLFPVDDEFAGTIMSNQDLKKFEVVEVQPKEERIDGFSKTVRTPANFVYRVAPDRPLEKYTSYEGPITIDSYMYLKFGKLESEIDRRFTQMDWRLSELEKSLTEIKSLLGRPQVLMPQGSQPEVPQEVPSPQETSKFL